MGATVKSRKKKTVKAKKPLRVKKPAKAKKPVKAKKPAPRKTAARATAKPVMKKSPRKAVSRRPARAEEKVIGRITHYFPKVRAAVLKLRAPLAVGEKIKIKGHTTDFIQTVSSLQIDHVVLQQAKKGDIIGLQVQSRVRRHDMVTKA